VAWNIICSKDRTLLAQVIGDYPDGERIPADAYKIIGGQIRTNIPGHDGQLVLVCPNHFGRALIVWDEVARKGQEA
jgi:hypothetical protein